MLVLINESLTDKLFHFLLFFALLFNSCKEDKTLYKQEVEQLVNGELMSYLDKDFPEYIVYSKAIKVIDTFYVSKDIEFIKKNKSAYIIEPRVSNFKLYFPKIDSLNWEEYGFDSNLLSDSIPELYSKDRMIGISYPIYSQGFYYVVIKRLFNTDDIYCGTGLHNYCFVYFKKEKGTWSYQFDFSH